MIMTMDELDMEMLKNVLNSCGLMLNGMEGNQAASVLEIPENMTYVNQAAYPRNRAQVYKKLANKNFSNKNKLIKVQNRTGYNTLILQNVETDKCLTTFEGPQQNVPCVFPFVYGTEGTSFHGCTLKGNDQGDHRHWCSTKVDGRGVHIGGEGNWGICAHNCPKDTDGIDQIRFRIKD